MGQEHKQGNGVGLCLSLEQSGAKTQGTTEAKTWATYVGHNTGQEQGKAVVQDCTLAQNGKMQSGGNRDNRG